MTKTTEELRHEMFDLLGMVKHQTAHAVTMRIFEESLEAYLEALRQERASLSASLTEVQKYSGILSDAYERQKGLTHAACVESRDAWGETYDLKRDVRELREANDNGCRFLIRLQDERDELRNKLQAFEFANQSAGEFLQQARAKVKAQRQSIGQLKNERDNAQHALKVKTSKLEKAIQELQEARQVIGSTVAQNRRYLISCAKCGGSGRELIGMHTQDHAPVTVPCSKCAHLRAAQEPKMEFVCHAEFDNFIRVSCTACGQEKDVPK